LSKLDKTGLLIVSHRCVFLWRSSRRNFRPLLDFTLGENPRK